MRLLKSGNRVLIYELLPSLMNVLYVYLWEQSVRATRYIDTIGIVLNETSALCENLRKPCWTRVISWNNRTRNGRRTRRNSLRKGYQMTLGEWIAMQSKALRTKYGVYYGQRHPAEDGIEPLKDMEDFPELEPLPEERRKILPMNRDDYRRNQRPFLPRALRKDTFTNRRREERNERRKPADDRYAAARNRKGQR